MTTIRNKAGFTLIEVALAVVVVGVGIMAVFSLIASGLDSSRKAIEETQAAIFANSVFNGLRSAALIQSEKGTQGSASGSYWQDFWSSPQTITVAADSTWNPAGMTVTWGQSLSSPAAVNFVNQGVHVTSMNSIVNNSLSYCLFVDTSHVQDNTSPKVTATLYVWPGKQFSRALSATNAIMFYTEFNDPGDL